MVLPLLPAPLIEEGFGIILVERCLVMHKWMTSSPMSETSGWTGLAWNDFQSYRDSMATLD